MRKSGPPKGLISYLVLELLDERPHYGYEILKEIRDLSGGHWEPSYGSVYPVLHKFEEKGWTTQVDRENCGDRKYFELTDDGGDELARRRSECGATAGEFAEVILGFYHVFVAFATDGRFEVDPCDDGWRFDEACSEWICERMLRHHERDFGAFERRDDPPGDVPDRRDLNDVADADAE